MNSTDEELIYKILSFSGAFFLGMTITACLSQRNYDLIHYPCPRDTYQYEEELYEKTHKWDFETQTIDENKSNENSEEGGLDDGVSTSLQHVHE